MLLDFFGNILVKVFTERYAKGLTVFGCASVQVFVLHFDTLNEFALSALTHIPDDPSPHLLACLPIALSAVKDRERRNDECIVQAVAL